MVFEGNRIKHMTKIWNDTISLQQLGWGHVIAPPFDCEGMRRTSGRSRRTVNGAYLVYKSRSPQLETVGAAVHLLNQFVDGLRQLYELRAVLEITGASTDSHWN